ncbi:glycosyltransferase family 4 protein [Dermabacteraceae bacterium P7006]
MRERKSDRKKKILLATRLFTPEPAAASFRNEALARAMQDAGLDLRVLTSTYPRDPAASSGLKDVRRFPVLRDKQGYVRGYASYLSFDIPLFFRVLFTRNLGAVVVEPPPTTGLVVMIAAALRRVPYIFYAADVWADATQTVPGVPGWIQRAVRWAETTVWKRAAKVLTISEGVNDRIRQLIGDDANLVMVGNGINTDLFVPEGEKADVEVPFFLYAGTVSEWHGAGIFLDAFSLVRQRVGNGPDAPKMLFFSDGAEKDFLEKTVVDKNISGVKVFPKTTPEKLLPFLRSACATLSSVAPGKGYDFAIPTKIYASTACGTPVVHTGVGAAVEMVRRGRLGWECPYDAESVAEAMLQSLEGKNVPTESHLREWTLTNASLSVCGERGAKAVADLL